MGEIIINNLHKFHALGVMHIGIFSHIIDNENDFEVYIIPSERGYKYFAVEELLQELFPDYNIGLYDEDDRHALGESVIYGIQFCY